MFLLRGVPNDQLKWNYYKTAESRAKYLDNIAKGDFSNEGLGRWWSPVEIDRICTTLNLDYVLADKALLMSDYRMDILISK